MLPPFLCQPLRQGLAARLRLGSDSCAGRSLILSRPQRILWIGARYAWSLTVKGPCTALIRLPANPTYFIRLEFRAQSIYQWPRIVH